ncbi:MULTISPECIES: glutathione S-transferase family protein [unclassified Pseudomonas]|uniref:glutathione S-transferase family protein n=1 Tax=unclassified Pseudomonas TaxID=196821 RepID=UPI00244C378C|nr:MULTISPECIES: glutathione S-transferase family protein [unclassified Pseudomonas]MDG9924520.1 glutathione S-transferase family protein [Pseudomonas sp. GD04045]MDH0035140.1 glutathione S-transferase family protein [Pseudomonas sp. GD04019]
MSLIVYGAPLSPFVRKLRLCLIEKGLDYQLEIVTPFGQPDWYRELNPLGRIPAFRDGDLTLADSSVICQYLEEQYPQRPALFGQGAAQKAKVRWLEKYGDYELAPLCTFGVFRNRLLKPMLGQSCDEDAVQSALNAKLPKHFDYLEQTLGGAQYFVGNELTQADLAIYTQLQNMEHGGETLNSERWPHLAAHYQRIQARDSVQSVLPGELKVIAKITAKA